MELSKKEKSKLVRIIAALCMFAVVFTVDLTVGLSVGGGKWAWLLPFALYLVIYIVIGYDVLWRAVRNILHGQVFDENFLMCIATIGAFALAIYRGAVGEKIEGFDEACAVLLFYQVGEWFQSYATGKSRRSISALMDIRPDYANVRRGNELVKVDPSEVRVGEIIVVNPGEKIPLDGEVVSGASALDAKALTGESLPVDVKEGDGVTSGCVNLSSQLSIKVEKEFYDSAVSKILELVENASSYKSKAENFITKFARIYTPAVVTIALLLAVVPSLVTGNWLVWIYRALGFLVVSCPCALVISIPLSFFSGIGAASRHGILIKGSDYLEKYDSAKVFVFDKTGTLTKGGFSVVKVTPTNRKDEILRLAAIAESGSSHPIATSVCSTYSGEIESGFTPTVIAGEGIEAKKDGSVILCGNASLMRRYGVKFEPETDIGTVVYVAHDGKYVGSLLFADEPKPEAREVLSSLGNLGCRTVMLTGDNARVAGDMAARLNISEYRASLLPQNKVEELKSIIGGKNKGEAVCFVGDGINDAPVLMSADIGIAMGGVGSDAAIEASDIVLMRDDLKGLPLLKRIAKKTMRIVKQNIVFALGIKLAILLLSALGIANMWIAVFGDVGVAVLAILNAMRVGKID